VAFLFIAILDPVTREALEKAGIPRRELNLFEDLARVVLYPRMNAVPDNVVHVADFYLSAIRGSFERGETTFDEYSAAKADLNLILSMLKERWEA